MPIKNDIISIWLDPECMVRADEQMPSVAFLDESHNTIRSDFYLCNHSMSDMALVRLPPGRDGAKTFVDASLPENEQPEYFLLASKEVRRVRALWPAPAVEQIQKIQNIIKCSAWPYHPPVPLSPTDIIKKWLSLWYDKQCKIGMVYPVIDADNTTSFYVRNERPNSTILDIIPGVEGIKDVSARIISVPKRLMYFEVGQLIIKIDSKEPLENLDPETLRMNVNFQGIVY